MTHTQYDWSCVKYYIVGQKRRSRIMLKAKWRIYHLIRYQRQKLRINKESEISQ